MERVGIEFLSVFDMPIVKFIHTAADLGCHYISHALTGGTMDPGAEPEFNLYEDTALRRHVIAALRDREVTISLGEGFFLVPGGEVLDRAGNLDVMLEVGIRRVNIVSMEPDLSRTLDQYGTFAERALSAGMEEVVTEFAPGLTVADLATALRAVDHVGRKEFKLLIDTMHLIRSGSTPGDLAAVDPAKIGYVQLSDVPLKAPHDNYMQEAMRERMAPGEGELPLQEILDILPPNLIVGLEVPQIAKKDRGLEAKDWLKPAVDATREMLARVAANRRTPNVSIRSLA